MSILLSNDDGISSPGLAALKESLAPLDEVWVVAPDRDQSAVSHSLTLHRPLRIEQVVFCCFSASDADEYRIVLGGDEHVEAFQR